LQVPPFYNVGSRETNEISAANLPAKAVLQPEATVCERVGKLRVFGARSPWRLMSSSDVIARSCPVCSHPDSKPGFQKGALKVVRCVKCSMLFANPVPAELASGRYYHDAGPGYYLSPAKLESDYAPVRYERELKLFRRHCSAGAILDVGCSSGAFLFQVKSRWGAAFETLGTDVSGAPLDYAESRGVPVARGNFLEQELPAGKFDALTFWAVLEHLLEPGKFLDKAWQVLKPGGLCFILVPNMDSLAVRWLGTDYRYIYPEHLNYFTRSTLGKLAGRRFRVVEMVSLHFNPIVIWQDSRRRGKEPAGEERARLLQRTTALKQNPLLAPLKIAYRVTETILGRFNLADNLAVVLRKES
jgi:2-polyprenyl-3-methyl-5-hydroxy-6-metoxy-1,4-benzoquinol methylase